MRFDDFENPTAIWLTIAEVDRLRARESNDSISGDARKEGILPVVFVSAAENLPGVILSLLAQSRIL